MTFNKKLFKEDIKKDLKESIGFLLLIVGIIILGLTYIFFSWIEHYEVIKPYNTTDYFVMTIEGMIVIGMLILIITVLYLMLRDFYRRYWTTEKPESSQ